ncbi:hypothetical protein GR212_16690 [Rhizobium lusitanum]|uniref:Uncharacterized protein n=1 Tax=Rhizobium lusitanum TaxID=293958 RepID=A0A6L9UAR9_9HYPH|nr:hypothetical protein [Rhizobium lusitanum]NEI71217.1 hypothetical protein [Rhizobium lusitanum]
MTKSLWLFAFTWIVLVLQYVPIIGPILMILGASVWPILTINLAFASLAMEALTDRDYRVWLILPLLYFGGNFVLAGISEYKFLQLSREIQAKNANQAFAFSGSDALVVNTEAAPVLGLPVSLVENFVVSKVYEKSESDDAPISAWKIGTDPLCSKLWADRSGNNLRIVPFGLLENGKLVAGMCMYRLVEKPAGRIVTLTVTEPIEHQSFLLPYKTQIITIADETGNAARLSYAEATPWTWIPMPIGGCFYGEGRHKPTCFFGPLRIFSMPALGAAKDATALVAKALDLEWKPASKRRREIGLQDMKSDMRPSVSF